MIEFIIKLVLVYLSIGEILKTRLIAKRFTFLDFNYASMMTLGDRFAKVLMEVGVPQFVLQQTQNFGKVLKFTSRSLNKPLRKSLFDFLLVRHDILKCVHTLILNGLDVKDVSKLEHIHTLDLQLTKVEDVSKLGRVHTLKLCCTKVTDVSALGCVYDLNLSGTKVSDVSTLGTTKCNFLNCTYQARNLFHTHIHTLALSYTKITNVTGLGYIHTLNLSNTEVADVSALSSVKCNILKCVYQECNILHTHIHNLNLSGTRVADVSGLGNVHTLNLDRTQVEDVSSLGIVGCLDKECKWSSYHSANHDVSLCNTWVKHVTTLKYVHILNLGFTKVKDANELASVQCNLTRCAYRSSEKMHTHIHHLNLKSTDVADVSALGNVSSLDLSFTEVVDVSNLSNVHKLVLDNTRVSDVSMLTGTRILTILGTHVTDISSISKTCPSIKWSP
ncbi:MAG TPA: hypothetical protein VLE02_01495 [Nitrosarchaeum sp.]|nr:hypothetical protein [Nitrosarchaeum sp.]